MNRGVPPRSYDSPVRAAHVEQTRERILEAARGLLVAGGVDGMTLPKVAEAAQVSAPTVYRHFATADDLIAAFLEWIRPQIGQVPGLLDRPPDEAHLTPLENFPLFEKHGAMLKPLMDSRVFNQIRVKSVSDRAKRAGQTLQAAAPTWSTEDVEAAAGVLYVLTSPQAWRWLRETWGLDADLAARAASWAMETLVERLSKPGGLTPGTPKRRRTAAPRSKGR